MQLSFSVSIFGWKWVQALKTCANVICRVAYVVVFLRSWFRYRFQNYVFCLFVLFRSFLKPIWTKNKNALPLQHNIFLFHFTDNSNQGFLQIRFVLFLLCIRTIQWHGQTECVTNNINVFLCVSIVNSSWKKFSIIYNDKYYNYQTEERVRILIKLKK